MEERIVPVPEDLTTPGEYPERQRPPTYGSDLVWCHGVANEAALCEGDKAEIRALPTDPENE